MSLNFAPAPRSETIMGRVFDRTRHFGLMLVLAIIATFTVAIPSASATTVSSVFPESGPNVGGTPVTLVGEGFGVSGTPTVTVGGANATSVVRKSDTELTFVTPAGSGPSDIVVTLPAGADTVTVTDGFTYDSHLITPAVETINPASGGQTGGELITITGHNLQYVTSLTVGTSGGIPWENFVSRDAAEGKFISFMSPYQTTVGAKEITLYGGAQTVTEFAGYTANAPAITKITPNSGSTSATSAVVIDGVGFASSGTVGVTVGGVPATGVQRVSPTQIKATFPTNTAGAKDVVVTIYNALTAPSTVTATRESGFLYIAGSSAPTFSAVTPARGVVAGGNTVTITGTNLRGTDGNAAEITFDGIPATNVVISVDRKSATVTVPAHAAGAVTVAVETIDGRAAKPTAYTYAAVPTITSISPTSGVIPGGTLITINGTHFGTGTPIVTVGGAPALCTRLVSPTVIEAVTPPGSAGAVNVSVDPGTGSGTATSTGGFSYVAPMTTPAISSISPNTGLVTGGTNITITTTGVFPTGTPVVLVGNGCATNVTRVSATVITATTPAGTVGAQNVSVTFATAHSSNLSSFTYTAAPAITTIVPARGGITGNTNVTITGVGFGNSGTPTVTFGGISATNIVRINDSTITATTPASSAGAKTVVVTPASAPAITRASAYTYDLPAITSITPNSGVVTGGNKVTIIGTGFGDTGTPTVLVNGTTATNIVRLSSTQITAVVPAGVTGLATFNVTPTTGTGAAINSTLFTYMPKRVTPLVTSSSPTWVAEAGNTLVYITGSNFRGSNGQIATVTMGGVAVTDLVVSADGTSMSFRTPALGAGYYAVRVATNEGIVSHSYHRVAAPPSFGGGGGVVCDAVSPRNWTPAGGTSVTINGSGFAAEFGAPRVSISGVDATVTAYTDTSITFLDPGGNLGTFDIDIVLSNGVETTLSDCGSRLGYSVITAQDKTINFGATTPAFTRTVTGMVGSDALTGLTYTFQGKNGTSYGPSTTAPTAAGEYRIIPSDAAVTPGPSSNYTFNYVEGTYTINGIDATVTAAARTIQYGDPAPTFSSTATGLVSGHSLTGATYKFVGTGGTFYPESTTVPTGVGTYSVVPSDATVTGGAQTNYFFTYVGATFTISQRAITVTADAKSKTYGDNDPTLTYTVTTGSLVGSDSLAGSLGRSEGENVGTYAINIGELSEYNPNYNITFVSRNLVINRKTISVVANPQTKGYGDSDPELTYTSSGLIGGDSLSGSMSRAPGNAVGTYAISQGTLTGGGNYTISSFTGANLTITAKSIELTVSDQYITYGDANPINSFSLTDGSLNSGDSISSLTYTYSTSQFNVGQYAINGATPVFSSGSAGNYIISIVPGTLTIERRSITLSAADKSKTYGSADPALTYTVSSGTLASGDTISGSLSREPGQEVGTYQITAGTVSAGDNYEVTVGTGTLTINQRPITITADAKTKTYGDSDPTPSWQVTTGSLAYSDTLAGSLGRADGENVGTYAYNIGELGEYNPSYDITFVSRNLTVTRKTISVTLDDQSKSYGDNDPEFTYSSSGLINGDQLTGSPTRVPGENVGTYSITTGTLSGGGNYTISGVTPGTLTISTRSITLLVDDKNMTYGDSTPSNSFGLVDGTFVGSDAISSLTYSYSSAQLDAGSYSISGATPVFSSGSAANYTITVNPGTLTVDPRTVYVSAADKSKQYGNSDPSFTYTVTPGGLVGGDTLSGSLERQSGEERGTYEISAGSLTAGSNYTVQVSSGTLTINQRAITVTADAKSKTYGDPDPTPSWQVTTGSLAFSDTLVGALGRADGEDVGTYAYTAGEVGEYNPNYDITFVSRNLTITRKTISVTLDDQSKSYGDNDPEFTYSSSGLMEDDQLTGTPARVLGQSVGTYAIGAGTLSGGGNYTISGVTPGTLTIDPRPITLLVDDKSMTYGDSLPSNSFGLADGTLVGSDAISSLTYTYSSADFDAGSYSIYGATPVFSTGSAANYTITVNPGTLTVERRAITLSAVNKIKTYGNADPELTYSVASGTLASGDTISGSLSRDSGEDVGTYQITPGSVSAGDNYDVTVANGTLTINQRPVTVTADAKPKTYGDPDPSPSWQLTAGTLAFSDSLVGALGRADGENVGTYAYTVGEVGEYNPNYNITFVSRNLTVTAREISVQIDNVTKGYGESDPTYTFTAAGFLENDSLSGSVSRATGEAVGDYTISAGTLSGGSNYVITSITPGTLTIEPLNVTITADNQEMTYGDAEPSNSFTTSVALAGSDAISGVDFSYSNTPNFVGQFDIIPANVALSSGLASNYNFSYENGVLDVAPANVEITISDETRQYGETDPVWITTVTGGELFNGDPILGEPSRDSGDGVGDYTIRQGTLDVGSNYNLTVVEGTLTITKAPLTVSADDNFKTYGDTDPALTFQAPGLYSGDELSGSLERVTGENVDTYSIERGTLDNANYDISFVSGTFTIHPRNAFITIDSDTKYYGDADPVFTASSADLVNGDELTGDLTRDPGVDVGMYNITIGTMTAGPNYNVYGVSDGILWIDPLQITVAAIADDKIYGDADPIELPYEITEGSLIGSDQPTGSVTREKGEDVGVYAINASGLDFGSNYAPTYVGANFVIDPRELVIAPENESKQYGADDPILGYSISSGELQAPDQLSGALTRDPGEAVGSYSIRAGALTAGPNYTVTVSEAVFEITSAAITITAAPKSKTYGDSDPEFTWTITSGVLAEGDNIAGSLSRDTGENVGSYAITQGSLGDPNYDITFVSANLTVSAKDITVVADNKSKYYGDSDPTLTFSSSDLVEGDLLSGTATRAAGEAVSDYSITQGSVTGGLNYNIVTFTAGTLSIDPRPITVTMDDASKDYGTADPASWAYDVTVGNLVNSDTATGSGTRTAGTNAGTYPISEGTLNFGSNYDVTFVPGTFTIDPLDLVLSATDKTKQFGGSDPALTYTFASGALIGGDTLSGSLSRSEGETVGSYTISSGTITGGSNYNVTVNAGTFEITTRPITVTAAPKSKTYGDNDPSFTWSVTTGSLVSGHDLTGDLARDAGEPVGNYAITQGSLDNSNYDITFVSADLTITRKTIAVTLDDQEKVYGDNDPEFTYSSTGLLDGDELTGTPTRVTGQNVGTFAISAGTLTGGSNYTISGITPGTLTIDPRPITVTMDDNSKDYGTADPGTWTYDVTAGNLVNSDTATGSGARTLGANAGTYPISQGTLNFGSNYDVTFVPGTFTIDPIDIELTAADKTKQFGASDPAFTYEVTSGMLIGSDTLSGSLSRDPGEAVGTYSITAGSISGGSNYNVTVIGGSLEITAVAITVTATNEAKAFGDDDPALGWNVTSGALVAGHDLTGELSRASGETVGNYAISQGSLGNSTYDITFVGATLEITRKNISVTVDSQEKVYGESDPEFTYTATGLVDGFDLSGSLTRASGENVGSRAISQGTLSGGDNYTISSFTGSALTITKRPVTLTVADQSMEFGDTIPSNSFEASDNGLVFSDSIGGLTYGYDSPVSNAGTYVITGSSPSFTTGTAANYDVTFVDGELTVDPKPLTYTLADRTIGWGEAIPTFTGTTGDLVGSDAIGTLSFTYDGSSTEPSTPGTYEAGGEVQTFGSGLATNYVITVVPATLTVTGPQYLTFTPDEGFVTGGMPFEISGSGFGFDNPTVEFDGLAATDVVLVDSNTITGLTPEHPEGLVDVVVTTTEGAETLTGVYTYIPLPPSPEISTMFPPQGPTVGGTLVTFTGSNLWDTAGNPAQVTFDGLAGTEETVSEDGTTLTVRTPAHIVETVDVEVSTDTGIITLPLAFTYFDGPVGDVSGKLWVDTNFDAALQDSESILPNMEIALVREGDLEPQFGPTLSPLQMFKSGIGSIIPRAKALASPLSAGVVYYWVGTTDADGNYTIPQLPYGNYTLVYSMPPDFQETVGGGTPGAIRFVLQDPVLEQDLAGAGFSNLVSNQIVLEETGEPIPFAEVLLRWSGSDGELGSQDDVLFPIVTDENGEFIVGGLISGVYDVETYADDPLDAMSKPVVLGAYVTQEGGIWELFDEPEGGGGDDGGLAETGFSAGSMTLYALGVFAAGLALAVIRRTRVRVTQ